MCRRSLLTLMVLLIVPAAAVAQEEWQVETAQVEELEHVVAAASPNCSLGVVYDDGGQLLTGSYMDYTMPRAANVPSFEVVTSAGTACTANSLGVKGCGEAGAIAAPAAVMNAVHDALAPVGVKHVEMPATPLNVWQSIHGAAA